MKMAIRHRINRTEQMLVESSLSVPTGSPAADAAPALLGAPLFEDLDAREIAAALADFQEVRFPAGRRVVLEGLRGTDFFLVVVGTAAVLMDGWRVATLGPGDFFGEIAVLDDGLRTASIRAETPLHCLVLPNGKLEELVRAHPQVGLNLLRVLATRLRGMTGHRQPPAVELAGA